MYHTFFVILLSVCFAAACEGQEQLPAASAEPFSGAESAPTEVVGEIKVFVLKSAPSPVIVNMLNELIPERTMRIIADDRTNSIIVTGTADQLLAVEALLSKLDGADQNIVVAKHVADTVALIQELRELQLRHGSEHPSVRKIRDRLAAEANSLATLNTRPGATSKPVTPAANNSSKDLQKELAQLRIEYDATNKHAHELAESIRKTPLDAKKAELRTAVQRSFILRQSLLRAESVQMQTRLLQTQQSIDMRERIADQIVDRRMEDLLNPQLKWEEKLQPEVTSAVNASEPDIRYLNAATSFVPELEGDWHRVGASAHQTGTETPHFNITIHGNTWTNFIDQKSEAIKFVCDTIKKTIEFKSTPPVVYSYEVHGAAFMLKNETLTLAFDRGHRLQPDALSELEGDWHQTSATDKDGNPLTVRPANMSFRKDRYTFAYQGGQHDRRVEVFADKKEIRYFKEGEYNGFVQDYYLLEGDKLTIYDENRRNVYQRGHVALPKSVSKATEEQKSLWRSAIVDIFREYNSAEDGTRQDPVGKGVVISPKGLVICQVPEEIHREKDSKTKFVVRFDDGGSAYTTIVEEADHGWFALQPTPSGNHQFPIATAEINSGDQVHLWACDSSSPPQRVTVDLATVILLNRQTAKADVPVCQLTRPTDFRAESCPVLSVEGELLGITLRDTGDLVLAVPGSQLKSMFPKTFTQ